MDMIQVQCGACGAVFLAILKEGEIECPKCKAKDTIEFEEA